MDLFKASIVKAILLTSASTVFAAESCFDESSLSNLKVYSGFDLQNRYMQYKKNEGSQFFKKNSLQGDVFLGLKLHKNFGVELGYEQTQTKKKDVTLNAGDQNLGGDIVPVGLAPVSFKTRAKIKGWYFSLMGFLPLEAQSKDLSLFAGVGVARLNAKLERSLFNTRTGPLPAPLIQSFNQKNNKYVLRLTAGAQYLLTENLGIRGVLSYENTSKLQPQSTGSNGFIRILRLKDSFSYGLGVFFNFF